MEKPIETYTSRDLWLTAALISLGMELLEVQSQRRHPDDGPGPAWSLFILRDHPDRPRWVQEYLAGDLHCPVVKLRSAIGVLRDRMRAVKGTAGGGDAA